MFWSLNIVFSKKNERNENFVAFVNLIGKFTSSVKLISISGGEKTKNISLLHENIGFDEEYCYTIIAVDSEGDQSGFSKAICGKTNKPPFLKIKNLFVCGQVSGESSKQNIVIDIFNKISNLA